ncbi:ribbon-helix-helix protein, CopG family [Egbenema bharatensis]|uniref:ribbon-helix-helix protein, CopG family n=1 Tax=Egbenema bharatensis TaxID=3463334 RepID=UPI003A86FFC9
MSQSQDETRTRVNMTLEQQAIEGLDRIAQKMGVSRSELVNQIGKGTLPLYPIQITPDLKLMGKLYAFRLNLFAVRRLSYGC